MFEQSRGRTIGVGSGLAFVLAFSLTTAGTPVGAQTVTISVDASADRHPISPLIYGVAYGDAFTLADLNSPLNRQGGNPTTRYNWQVNADNRASDYFFESIQYNATPGGHGDDFIAASKAAGAQAMLTIPMLGWVAKVGPGGETLSSFSIAKYGPQTDHDPFNVDFGNGILTNGLNVTGNDPNDADVPADSIFQMNWTQHLIATWGTSASGGLRYYLLDNEPSIWFAIHRDVHPVGPKMDEIRDKTIDYATRIKALDPSALVLGPEEWGWSGYFYSGFDQQYGSLNGFGFLPDRAEHGGVDYLPYYLAQMQSASASAGKRLLDFFSVHFYPQSGEFSDDVSASMQLLRNRSTRSLWDPAYTDESWIADQVQLVPRMKSWVSTYYPNTPTALTEYNWGAEGHINGATAQADILGILGREGIDLATRWTTPDPSTPTYNAMKIYRNYDGSHSAFGQTNVRVTVPNPDQVSAFAAVRTPDGALTLMVVDKELSGSRVLSIGLSGFSGNGPVQAWQLTATNTITRLADLSISANTIAATVPAQSITLFVVRPVAATGAAFYSLPPCRVFDTRNAAGAYGAPALSGQADRVFVLAGQCGIPSTATAIAGNLTVTAATSAGFLTVRPNGAALPLASSINFHAAQTRANNVVLPLGASGDVDVYGGIPGGHTVQTILDVNGYFQ